jgi:hypothetical protein
MDERVVYFQIENGKAGGAAAARYAKAPKPQAAQTPKRAAATPSPIGRARHALAADAQELEQAS